MHVNGKTARRLWLIVKQKVKNTLSFYRCSLKFLFLHATVDEVLPYMAFISLK